MAQVSTAKTEALKQWQIYLGEMERKLEFHCTKHYLERRTVEALDHFQTATEPLDRSVSTVPEFIAELEDKCPQLKVITDDSDKEHLVLHLIDKALDKQADVLEQKIDLKYTGKITGLIKELERRRIAGIVLPTGGSNSMFQDLLTDVQVDAEQKSVRNILTHCVDLDKYSWSVWIARTSETEDGSWKTEIRFTGPREE